MGQKPVGFLHYNQIFDVIIEKSDYDIKNVIVMPQAPGLTEPLIILYNLFMAI